MTDLDIIRDLCGSLPPFPDGCEVTGVDARPAYPGVRLTVRAMTASGSKVSAYLYRDSVGFGDWRLETLLTPCRKAVETCLAGSHPASGNGFVAGSVAGSDAQQAGCDRV